MRLGRQTTMFLDDPRYSGWVMMREDDYSCLGDVYTNGKRYPTKDGDYGLEFRLDMKVPRQIAELMADDTPTPSEEYRLAGHFHFPSKDAKQPSVFHFKKWGQRFDTGEDMHYGRIRNPDIARELLEELLALAKRFRTVPPTTQEAGSTNTNSSAPRTGNNGRRKKKK